MLYDLFSWINGEGGTKQFPRVVLSHSDIDHAAISARDKDRKLIAALRDAKFAKVNDEKAILKAKTDLQYHTHFLSFLSVCKQHNTSSACHSSYSLALDYLLFLQEDSFLYHQKDAKVRELFQLLLADDKPQALALYKKNHSLLPRDIYLLFSIEKTNIHLITLSMWLGNQHNPLGIAPLFKSFIGDTEQFAASLLFLLKRGVKPKAILESGLLQHFFLYDLAFLDLDNSQLKLLFTILKAYEEAKELVVEAQQISCGAKDFEFYSLSGQKKAFGLNTIKQTVEACDFSASRRNVFALYDLFGASFLGEALLYRPKEEREKWLLQLKTVLNHKATFEHLSEVVNEPGRANPVLLEQLALLLDNQIVDRMLENHYSSVLHLLPYKPFLRKKISLLNMQEYLHSITNNALDAFDLIPQLTVIIETFRKINKPIADLAYSALLEVLVLNPQFLDDENFINYLKKYPEKENIIEEKIGALELQFETCLMQQLQLPQFDVKNVYAIEDAWLAVSKKLSTLNLIEKTTVTVPRDKYSLFVRIVSERINRQEIIVNCQGIAQLFDIEPALKKRSITEYERFLIELLTTLDNLEIRQAVIATLNTKYEASEWLNQNYGGKDIFHHAVNAGNVGLLAWLINEAQLPLSQGKLLATVNQALEEGQWPVVNFIVEAFPNRLGEKITIKKVMIKAVQDGQLATIQTLVALNKLSKTLIHSALNASFEAGQASISQFFLDIGVRVPKAKVIAKGFKNAVKSGRFDRAELFSSFQESALLKNEVKTFLMQAINNDALPLIKFLCRLKHNVPAQRAFEIAFESAARKGSLSSVSYFCDPQHDHRPRMASIEKALHMAALKGHYPIVQFFSESVSIQFRTSVLEQAFKTAVQQGHGRLVDYFCSMKQISFSRELVDSCLSKAARNGHFAIVQCLCNYKIKPSKKGLRYARNAASSQHRDVAAYLNNPIPRQNAPPNGHPLPLRRAHNLSVFGVFANQPVLQKSLSHHLERQSISRMYDGLV